MTEQRISNHWYGAEKRFEARSLIAGLALSGITMACTVDPRPLWQRAWTWFVGGNQPRITPTPADVAVAANNIATALLEEIERTEMLR